MAADVFAVPTSGAATRSEVAPSLPSFDTAEVALLQACVGFHAKAQTDPGIRDRLYRLWCKLESVRRAA